MSSSNNTLTRQNSNSTPGGAAVVSATVIDECTAPPSDSGSRSPTTSASRESQLSADKDNVCDNVNYSKTRQLHVSLNQHNSAASNSVVPYVNQCELPRRQRSAPRNNNYHRGGLSTSTSSPLALSAALNKVGVGNEQTSVGDIGDFSGEIYQNGDNSATTLPFVTVLQKSGTIINRKLSFDSAYNNYSKSRDAKFAERRKSRPTSCRSTIGISDLAGMASSTSHQQLRWANRNRTSSVVGTMPNLPHHVTKPHKFSAPAAASPQPTVPHPHANVQVKISSGGGPPSPTADQQQNPLWNVSSEYMRVAGYSTPFNKLLSIKRKKATSPLSIPHHTLHQDTLNETDENAPGEKPKDNQTKDTNIVLPLDVNNVGTGLALKNGKSQRRVYGRLYTNQTNQKQMFKKRKDLFAKRIFVCNLTIIFAMIGIALTIVEAELTGFSIVDKTNVISNLLRTVIVFSTLVLLGMLMWYHAIEIKISVIDCGAHDWRVTLTVDRVFQMLVELILCSICPVPGHFYVDWVVINKDDHRQVSTMPVSLDVLLSLPMFSRFYLFGRFMALHSGQFQDAATRSIARLNRVTVDFGFVLKTLMVEHPIRVLFTFTVVFWMVISWISVQCERYDGVAENNHYLNAIWFTVITFMSIGYGDIVPNTYCGRVVAIATGIVGAGVSSALIAVMSLKLELSRAEKHVNNFMTDTKLNRQRKDVAATVLQNTWFIHKYKSVETTQDDIKVRFHQRKFLAAINEFRRIKWEQRKLAEQGNALVDVAKLQSDMHTILWEMQHTQDQLANQVEHLNHKVQNIFDLVSAKHSANHHNSGLSQHTLYAPTTGLPAIHPSNNAIHHPLSPVSETKSNDTQ